MPSTANKLLADIIDIYDNCIPNHHHKFPQDLRVSYNKLRKSVGKQEVEEPAFRAAVADPVVTYFSADTSVNPAVISVPTTGSPTINFTNGATFANGGWAVPTNAKITFTYNQNPFQDNFYPVSLQLTATALVDTTISLVVNQIPLLEGTYPISQAEGSTPGTYDVFVPAPCFLGGSNTFELVVTGGSVTNVTKVEVVSATGTGDVNATINALSQTLARLGAENGLIKNTWPTINTTIASHPQLSAFVTRGQQLQTQFDTLYTNMKQSAIDLKSFCTMYNQTYLPILLDNTQTRAIKLEVIADAQTQAQNAQTTTIATVNALTAYKTSLETFQADLQIAATAAFEAIREQLLAVAGQIALVRIELAGLQTKFNVTAAALGLTFFAGAVGIWASLTFLGPLGPFVAIGVAIVAVIGIAVSIGFLISLGIKINNKQGELNDLLDQQQALIAEENQIKQMLEDVTNISASLVQVAQYTQAFKSLWGYINTQLTGMITQFNNFPTSNSPVLFQIYVNSWTQQVQPYFDKVTTVLDAYIDNFPDRKSVV